MFEKMAKIDISEGNFETHIFQIYSSTIKACHMYYFNYILRKSRQNHSLIII